MLRFQPRCSRPCPQRIFGGRCPTTPCSRCRSSRFMGADPRAERHGRGPARHDSASCSGRCAAASAIAVIVRRRAAGRRPPGSVAASVISMGLISLPVMLRYGYDRRLASGVIAASGTHRADHPALAGADRAGRPARQVGRRHVRGCLHPRAWCWCSFYILYVFSGHQRYRQAVNGRRRMPVEARGVPRTQRIELARPR